MGRRVIAGWAALVYVFLYAPILIVVIYAFNGGRQVLNWEGFSTKWFGEALSDPDHRAAQEPSDRSRQRADRVRARDGAGTRPASHAALGEDADRRARLHDTRNARDRVRHLGADLLRADRRAARAEDDPDRARGVQRVRGRADRARARGGHGRRSSRPPTTSAPGRSPGHPAASHRPSSPAGCSRSPSPSTTSSLRSSYRARARRRCRCGSSRRCASACRRL